MFCNACWTWENIKQININKHLSNNTKDGVINYYLIMTMMQQHDTAEITEQLSKRKQKLDSCWFVSRPVKAAIATLSQPRQLLEPSVWPSAALNLGWAVTMLIYSPLCDCCSINFWELDGGLAHHLSIGKDALLDVLVSTCYHCEAGHPHSVTVHRIWVESTEPLWRWPPPLGCSQATVQDKEPQQNTCKLQQNTYY